MSEPKWLLTDFVIAVHGMLLAEHGGPSGVRDKVMLESALARPLNKYHYEPATSICELASAYSYGIAMNHPFVDGNKRTALMAGIVFLEINDVHLISSEAETAAVFEALAAGKLTEEELGRWFGERCST